MNKQANIKREFQIVDDVDQVEDRDTDTELEKRLGYLGGLLSLLAIDADHDIEGNGPATAPVRAQCLDLASHLASEARELHQISMKERNQEL